MYNGPAFIVDANVFIDLALYYPDDIAPTFWPQLAECAEAKQWLSIDRVRAEIAMKEDWVSEWANDHKTFFMSTERNDVATEYGRIQEWASRQEYRQAALDGLGRGADGWLVAYAVVEDLRVVTNEVAEPLNRKNVKIPDICKAFGVDCVNMFGMIRALGIRLGSAAG